MATFTNLFEMLDDIRRHLKDTGEMVELADRDMNPEHHVVGYRAYTKHWEIRGKVIQENFRDEGDTERRRWVEQCFKSKAGRLKAVTGVSLEMLPESSPDDERPPFLLRVEFTFPQWAMEELEQRHGYEVCTAQHLYDEIFDAVRARFRGDIKPLRLAAKRLMPNA